MDDREFEDLLRRALRRDFSAGTEGFRETLLARCLDELRDAALASGPGGGRDGARSAELGDVELELLSAAGDLAASGTAFDDNEP